MRTWRGIASRNFPTPETREALTAIDEHLFDLDGAMRRIMRAQLPISTGETIADRQELDLDDYLYLPGRVGGQTVQGLDSNPVTTFNQPTTGLTNEGDIGNPSVRFSAGGSGMFDIRPYLFDAPSTIEAAITNSSGVGVGVNFPSEDGTSAFRIASTTNRTYLQAGLKQSSGQVQNANMTIGGAGARVATSLATEFQRISFNLTGANLADGTPATANTARVAFNASADEYSGSTTANKGGTILVADLAGAAASDPAPVTIENTSGTSSRRLLDFRFTGSTGSSPNKVLGVLGLSIDSDGYLSWFNSGSRRGRMRGIFSGDGDGGFLFENTNNRTVMDLLPAVAGGFADAVATNVVRLGNTTDDGFRTFISAGGTNAFARLGIMATSVVLGPAAFGTMPAPTGSRILTVVNSAGTVLSGLDSAGAHFHVSGAGSGKVWTSDANGVGSWAAASGGTHTLLDGSTHTDTAAATVSRGSLIVGNSTPAWSELVIGAADTVLKSNGTDAFWDKVTAGDHTDRTRYVWIPATAWYNATAGGTGPDATDGTAPTQTAGIALAGAGTTTLLYNLMIPADYVNTATTWTIYYWNNGASTNNWVAAIYWAVLGNTEDVTSANDSSTQTTMSPNGTTNLLNIQQIGTYATFTAGDYVRVVFERLADNASDTNLSAMNMIGIRMAYTADS